MYSLMSQMKIPGMEGMDGGMGGFDMGGMEMM